MRMVMGVVLFAQIVTAPPVVSPSAVPSAPPPTIVHVQSSTLCTALRENVAPALFGLMRNDTLVKVGRASLLNLGNLQKHGQLVSSYNESGAAHVTSPLGMVQGNSHLFDIGRAIERNVETIDRILADPARFPDQPATDDEKMLARMKSELLNVLDKQKIIVNAFSGTSDTAMMDQFVSQSPSIGGGNSFSDTGIAGPLGGSSPIDNQEMATSPAFRSLMSVYAQANSISIAHLSPYDRLAELIGGEQLAIDASEGSANTTIAAVAAQCGAKPH
jgi:hypothetical protein